MKNILGRASDTMLNVQGTVDRIKKEYPDEIIIVGAATKARRTDDENNIGPGLGWATARRAALVLTDRAFYCGNWIMPLDKLKYTEYTHAPSIFGFKSIVMKIADNDGNHYQFGVNDMKHWLQQDVVKFKQTEPVAWYITYVWIVRIALLSLIIFNVIIQFDLMP